MTGAAIQMAARAFALDDRAWDRHMNPLSGWSRVLTLPVLALALCARDWLGWSALGIIAGCGVWLWVNPRIFRPPRSTSNWMSRAVLGERLWLDPGKACVPTHHAVFIRILIFVMATGVGVLAAGLVVRHAGLTMTGLILSVGGKLWFLDRMVWLLTDIETAWERGSTSSAPVAET